MQPNAPDLPPMRPMAPPPPASAPPSAAAPKAATGGTRRFRQALVALAGGGFGLIAVVCGGELVLRDGLKPSDLMATIEAQTELGVMNQKLGAAPGSHLLNEAQYQETLAQAQRTGAAKAELVFQRQLAAIQADRERVVQAYGTLYQRTNQIAGAGLQMEAQAQQFRQQLLASTNGGRAMVLTVEDGLCALGGEEACESARKLRSGMIEESTELTTGDLASRIAKLMEGIDDPASFTVHADERRYGTPAIHR